MPLDFNTGLGKNSANFAALSPIDYIARSAAVYGNRLAIVHGSLRQNWRNTYARARRLASALQQLGIGKGDTVAVMLPNTPAMVEAHFGVPMSGAVLNALNTRLDAETIAFMLNHGEAKVVLVDPEFAATLKRALAMVERPIVVIDVDDAQYPG